MLSLETESSIPCVLFPLSFRVYILVLSLHPCYLAAPMPTCLMSWIELINKIVLSMAKLQMPTEGRTSQRKCQADAIPSPRLGQTFRVRILICTQLEYALSKVAMSHHRPNIPTTHTKTQFPRGGSLSRVKCRGNHPFLARIVQF